MADETVAQWGALGGVYVHGYAATSGAQTAQIALYDANGAERAIGANERLIVDWTQMNSDADSTMQIFNDANGDGTPDASEIIDQVMASANGGTRGSLLPGRVCKKATKLKFKSTAGSAACILIGRVVPDLSAEHATVECDLECSMSQQS